MKNIHYSLFFRGICLFLLVSWPVSLIGMEAFGKTSGAYLKTVYSVRNPMNGGSSIDWAVSPDGRFISEGNEIISVAHPHIVATLPINNGGQIYSAAWSSSGKWLALCCGNDGYVILLALWGSLWKSPGIIHNDTL